MTLTPNTQITQENVGLLKAGDWLRFNHVPAGYTGNGIVQVKSTGDFALCLVGDPWPDYNPTRFTYIGPDLGDGWIGWSGGDCPVPGQMVDVRYSDHEVLSGRAGGFKWRHRSELGWSNIIAFRPALSPPAEGEVSE